MKQQYQTPELIIVRSEFVDFLISSGEDSESGFGPIKPFGTP